MSTLAKLFVIQPSVLLRKSPNFYIWYDGIWGVLIVAATIALYLSSWEGLIVDWQPWHFALLPLCLYAHILSNGMIHNNCHGNIPRPINRLVGEILGAVVMTRYASWEVLHQRHHRYSDDPEKDPHPVHPNFFVFLYQAMVINLERQLQNEFFDNHGDTPASRRRENMRSVLSFSVMIPLATFWYLLLGPWAFLFLWIPTQAIGWVFIAHFNWATHNAHDPSGDYKPVNLDHGWYWIGNRLVFGLYMHANHHKRANIFNPLKMEQVLAKRAKKRAAEEEPQVAA